MMNRQTLAGIGRPQPSQDRHFDLARVNRDPQPMLILAQVTEAALTDQLAIVRWQLDQVRQQIRAMQRNLRNTETTAETRARVLREMAVHIPASERSTVRR